MARTIKQKVPISEIVFNEDFYPRVSPDWKTSYDYAQSMKAGVKFSPITLALFNRKKVLVDGKHRIDALKLNKGTEIETEILIGLSAIQIFEEALRRNMNHGKRLSPYEKRQAILKLRGYKYDTSKISKIVQIPVDKIQNFVGQRLVNTITGETIVKSGIKHVAGKEYETQEQSLVLEEAQEGMDITDQTKVLKQLINLIKNDLLDLENPKILSLVKELKTLL
jgi:hypothetical protein